MELPLIAFCDGWARFFHHREEAEAYIEPVDVENGEWEIFDSRGRVYRLAIERRRPRGSWRWLSRGEEVVRVLEPEPALFERERLRELILRHLSLIEEAGGSGTSRPFQAFRELPLEELISLLNDRDKAGGDRD